MPILDIPGPFINETIIDADTVNRWRACALELDQLSYRTAAGLLSSPVYKTADRVNSTFSAYPDATKPTSSLRIWRGALVYRGGCTSLVFEGSLTKKKSESLHFYINGTDKANTSTNGNFTITIDISTGYTSGQTLELEVRRIGKTSAKDSSSTGGGPNNYKILDVYETPVTFSAWPGVPTFTTSFDASQANLMSSACTWLRDRIYAHPMNAGINYYWKNVTHSIETYDLWRGGIIKGNATDVCQITGSCTCYTSAEVINFYLNGTQVATYPASGTMTRNTTYDFSQSLSLSGVTLGARAELLIEAVITSPSVDDKGKAVDTPSVYSLSYVGTDAPSGGYPVATLPAALVPGATVSQATLTSTLNSICTVLSAIQTRIAATAGQWNRIYAMTRRPGWDDHQNRSYQILYVPGFVRRKGTTLFVSGKGLSLGWGGLKMGTDETKPYQYTFNRTDTLTPDTSYETKTVYPDVYHDLQVGTTYAVPGLDAVYVGERYDP
jgi:hypothetical protein